jgi:hypothetical protein
MPPLPPATAPSRPPAALPPQVNYFHLHKTANPPLPRIPVEVGTIRQVQALQPPRTPSTFISDQMDYLIQLLPPSAERMFRIYPEDQLREQIRQESREKTPPERAIFPEERPVTTEKYAARLFPGRVALAEPAYVNHKRLYFQDINSERYGWELGFAQPFVSTGKFFVDLALVPYRFASRPCDCIESSAGDCLPGDPVPYLCYPPVLSTTGALGEAGAILGLIAIFP